ncbi:hypothetical protein HPP92_025580 [Vanilla planifolia]|uniref:WAT1-related protein n=1 Tax=Vanilla planifolia TaxID=51239 RepID=A0A835PLA0_VANPL|nr:hypothetical protein HPP92_025580 [Vanilla planifolia]
MGLDFKPAAVMVIVSVAYAVMNVLVKEAIDGGMSGLVLITLRQLVAVLFMAPVAFVTERNVGLKLTGEIVLLVFVSALLGSSLTQIFFFLGLQYTSSTFSCAFLNMVPAMTFLIALPFRMERVDLGSRAAVLKVLGSLACVAGAALLASYRGVVIAGGKEHIEGLTALLPPRNWVTGSAALLAACMTWSSWFLCAVEDHKAVSCAVQNHHLDVLPQLSPGRRIQLGVPAEPPSLGSPEQGATRRSHILGFGGFGNVSTGIHVVHQEEGSGLRSGLQSIDPNHCGRNRNHRPW